MSIDKKKVIAGLTVMSVLVIASCNGAAAKDKLTEESENNCGNWQVASTGENIVKIGRHGAEANYSYAIAFKRNPDYLMRLDRFDEAMHVIPNENGKFELPEGTTHLLLINGESRASDWDIDGDSYKIQPSSEQLHSSIPIEKTSPKRGTSSEANEPKKTKGKSEYCVASLVE